MVNDESGHELIDELADEFLTRCLRGADPDIDDYCDAYPWLEQEIRQLFPMLRLLESNKASGRILDVPEIVGPYRVVREIGRGGMGFVFEAVHESSQEVVALKLLAREGGLDEDSAIQRFRREAKAVSAMQHDHVVPIHDVGQHANLRYLAMTLIDGSSLDRIIRLLASAHRTKRDGWFESVMQHITGEKDQFADLDFYPWVAGLGRSIAEALHAGHQIGILHRDVKPSNLLIDRTGKAWLADFGLAKMDDAKLTRTGQIIGTLRYLAPERLQGHCDFRADLYSLGLTLYELLALRPAHVEDDRFELIAAIERSDPDNPMDLQPRTPRTLAQIVMRAISKDPAQRFQSANDMAASLEQCQLALSASA
ncbi:MAG: serine/threonine-protein kinase [Planctomycetota bacterium]